MGRFRRSEDYLTVDESNNLRKIKKVYGITLKELGEMCGVLDKGYWSNIMSYNRPLPPGGRRLLKEVFEEYEV